MKGEGRTYGKKSEVPSNQRSTLRVVANSRLFEVYFNGSKLYEVEDSTFSTPGDKFSAAERPTDDRAYTHKLNFKLDTSFAVFSWMREGRWLRGVELEGSLDYVATGLPKAGDLVDGMQFVDNASPWSFSVVFVFPVASL